MADMPNDFWSGWIIILTTVSFVGLAWLVLSVYLLPATDQEEHEPVWDENLKEGRSAAPMWWFWLILAAMVFSVIYLILYPGMGSFKGTLQWSQGHQIEMSYEHFDHEFASLRADIASRPLAELQEDEALMGTARNIYARECAVCHGPDARGQASLFPDLRDHEWQWGDSAEQIEASIRNGRNAIMTSWSAVLGERVEAVADYVLVLGTEAAAEHPGQQSYNQVCIACHGPEGAGNPLLGAPNIANDIWLYGGSRETIIETIVQGRSGIMPAFGERLDDTQVRLLVAWLLRP